MAFLITEQEVSLESGSVLRNQPSTSGQWEFGKFSVQLPGPASNFSVVSPIGSRQLLLFDGYPSTLSGLPAEPRLIEAILGNREAFLDLRGSFAAALLDPDSDSVRLIRDRLGGRTLYYCESEEGRSFGSSSSALAALLPRGARENPRFIEEVLLHGKPRSPGLTAFQGIRELIPGEILCASSDRISSSITPFDVPDAEVERDTDQWIAEFRNTFAQAVDRLFADGRDTAVMLSGGMDSGPSAALALTSKVRSAARLDAVSWRLDEFPECDESVWVTRLAQELGLPLHVVDANRLLPYGALDADAVDPDFPIYNPFRPLVLACYAEAQRLGFPVILNASRGDQIYPPGPIVATDQWLRGHRFDAMRTLAGSIQRRGLRNIRSNPSLRKLLRTLIEQVKPGFRPSKPSIPAWLHCGRRNEAQLAATEDSAIDSHPFPDYAASLIGPPMSFGIAHEQGFANRFGLERRDPFQDLDLVRLMWQMPADLTWKDGREKWIMRQAMRGTLPEWHLQKGRTGLLYSFHDAGFTANRSAIRALLGENPVWQEWFDPGWIEARLAQADVASRDASVIAKCIGYTLWRKRLSSRDSAVRS